MKNNNTQANVVTVAEMATVMNKIGFNLVTNSNIYRDIAVTLRESVDAHFLNDWVDTNTVLKVVMAIAVVNHYMVSATKEDKLQRYAELVKDSTCKGRGLAHYTVMKMAVAVWIEAFNSGDSRFSQVANSVNDRVKFFK